MKNYKFCIDCAAHQPSAFGKNLATCAKSDQVADVVTGELRHLFCSTMRIERQPCGPYGNLFQSKPKQEAAE